MLEDFEPPVLLEEVRLPYPPDAGRERIEGDVRLHIEIDERGGVYRVELVSSPDERLSFAALGAATRMRFEPAMLKGVPVAVRIDHVLHFRLEPQHGTALAADDHGAPSSEAAGAEEEQNIANQEDREAHDAAVYEQVIRERAPRRSSSERRIGRDDIRRANKRTADDLLALVPGVHVAQHGAEGKGQQIFLRGFDAGHGSDVEVTVDGIPLNEASHVHGQGYLDLGFVIPETVARIDAYKGAHRLFQGPFATAGTVALTLGVPEEERGVRLRYEAGDTNRHRALAIYAPRGQPTGTFVAAELVHDDGFGELRQAQRASALGRVSVPLAGRDELYALTSLYAASFGSPGALRLEDVRAGREDFTGSYLDDTGGVSLRALVAAGYKGRVFGGQLDARLYSRVRHLSLDENYTGFLQNPDAGDRRLQRQTDGNLGFALDYERQLLHGLMAFAGVGVEGDLAEQSEHAVAEDGALLDERRSLSFSQQRTKTTTGLRWHGFGWLYLEGGLRLDVFRFDVADRVTPAKGDGARVLLSPRLVAAVGPFGGTRFFAAYGRGFRPPEARAFPVARPLEGVPPDPTVVDSGEVGVEWSPSDRLRTSLTAFALYVEREVLFDHLSGTNLAMNASARLGAEASASVAVARWLAVGGDVTVVEARYLESGEPVPGAPTLVASLHTTLSYDDAYVVGRWLLLGARPLGYGAQAARVAVLDVAAGYDLGPFSIDIAVDNALDVEWAEAAYAYASHWDRARPRSQLPSVHVVAGTPRVARIGLTAEF